MEHVVAKDIVLASLVLHVYQARGALFFEAPAIVVRTDISEVRYVEVSGTAKNIGTWKITDPDDIPDVIRLFQQKDPYLSGCVFLDTGNEFVLVDDRTLRPYPLFGRERRVRYA